MQIIALLITILIVYFSTPKLQAVHENSSFIAGILGSYNEEEVTYPPTINWVDKFEVRDKEEIFQAIHYVYTETNFPSKINVSNKHLAGENSTKAYLILGSDTSFYKVAMSKNKDTLYVTSIAPRSLVGIWSLDSVIKDKLTDAYIGKSNK